MRTSADNEKANLYLRRGLRELSRHNPAQALELFRKSIELTPPSSEKTLSRALYWLSIALLQLNKRDLAVKSLANAQKIHRQGYIRRFYIRHVNEYGMIKQPTKELDDLYAFLSIQLSFYLLNRPSYRFGSEAEHSMVLAFLLHTWKNIKGTEEFKSLDCSEKLLLFNKLKIDFPAFAPYSVVQRKRERQIIPSNIAYNQLCSCGSGLPFMQCCGRIRGISELLK